MTTTTDVYKYMYDQATEAFTKALASRSLTRDEKTDLAETVEIFLPPDVKNSSDTLPQKLAAAFASAQMPEIQKINFAYALQREVKTAKAAHKASASPTFGARF